MAQIQTSEIFADGQTVNAARLNNVIVAATALTGIISEQNPAVDAIGTDQVVVLRGAALHRSNVSTLPSGVTSVSRIIDSGAGVLQFFIDTPATTPLFHIGLDNQTANKVLAGPVSGSATTPTFRVLSPSDLPFATVAIGANNFDWSLGSCFRKTLTAPTHNFTFSNPSEGQTIRIRLAQDNPGGRHVVWAPTPAVHWPGGVAPVMTPGLGRVDIYTFHYIFGVYHGTFEQDFLP